MLTGNQIAQEIFDKFIQAIKDNKLNSGFFIISGPKHSGKKTFVLQKIKELNVLPNDLVILEDPGKIDGKEYQIKIDIDKKEQVLENNGKKFLNLGARQIIDFVSTTPFGDKKIVFIENIERLNISAANALLKTFEEMPSNVFIFATSSNKEKLLSTILSRAILINFYSLTFEEFDNFIKGENLSLSPNQEKILYAVSGGRIGLAKKFLSDNMNLLSQLETFLELDEKGNDINSRFQMLKDFLQQGVIDIILDGLLFYYTHIEKFDKVEEVLFIKQAKQANVNVENLLFKFCLVANE